MATKQTSDRSQVTRRTVSSSSRASKTSIPSSGSTAKKTTATDAKASSARTTRTAASTKAKTATASTKASTGTSSRAATVAGGVAAKTQSWRVSKGDHKFSNALTIIIGVAAVLLIVVLLDFFLHVGRIYNGVYVGDMALGGMTKSEAILALDNYFATEVAQSTVTA